MQYKNYIYNFTLNCPLTVRTWEKVNERHFSWRTSAFLIGSTYLKPDFPRNMNWFQNPLAFVEDDLWAKFTAGLEIFALSCKLKRKSSFEFSWVIFPDITALLKCPILLPPFGSGSEISRDPLVRCDSNFLAKRDWKKIPNTWFCKVKNRM